jgi:hypothetical protein
LSNEGTLVYSKGNLIRIIVNDYNNQLEFDSEQEVFYGTELELELFDYFLNKIDTLSTRKE